MRMSNKEIIQRLYQDGLNKHDLSVVFALYENCVFRAPGVGAAKGEPHRRFLASLLSAFPDCHITMEEQLAEGDKVATRWTFRATHKAEFMGIAATGNAIVITGICINRIVDGKITEELQEWDAFGLMRQLGVMPPKLKIDALFAG